MLPKIIKEVTESIDLQPLQYLAATRIAISACESKDLQNMIGRFRKTNGNKSTVAFSDAQWRQLRGKVKRKLNQIGIPHLIIDIVLETLWPISFEIYKWILYHVEDTGIDWSPNFYWTPRANIDYLKTAKILTKSEALDVEKRFKLACIYCLESKVRSLWDRMSLSERRSFFLRGNLKKSNQNPIVFYWTYYIQEVPIEYWDSKRLNPSYLMKFAVENGYLSATKFFLGKIKNHVRNRMISNCFNTHLLILYNHDSVAKDHLAIACFLICLFRWDYDNMRYFTNIYLFFRYFLEWPWQKRFMSVVIQLRRYLTEIIFGYLLEAIFLKVIGNFEDHDYKELFVEFWNYSWEYSLKYKTYVNTESFVGCKILIKFVKKHFGFVFEDSSIAMKLKFRALVFQKETSENETCFIKENVEFLKFLVRERVTTKSSIERFPRRYLYPDQEHEISLLNLPLEELEYLMDGILEIE